VLALGLGLQVACSIAEQHRAWIETAALGPTEFMCRVYFRTSAVPAPTIETPAVPQATRGGREAILVVEDEPPIRELAKSILEGYGYTVYEAGSGREALDIWEKNQGRIDLLFTDMVLPGGMSGRAVAQRLLAAKPLLKVVYTTGYSVELMQSNLVLRAGFNFLPKPYNTTMLAQAIRNCLDSPAGPQASSNAGTSQAQSDLAQNT
jgi:CheY-like chemotaxis protein